MLDVIAMVTIIIGQCNNRPQCEIKTIKTIEYTIEQIGKMPVSNHTKDRILKDELFTLMGKGRKV